MIRAQRPQDGILAEESGADATDRDGVWIVDPLDGTVNFSHGHPHFAVSLAWAWRGRIEVGVIYDPLRDELFSAMRGGGAHCNGRPIKCAGTDSLRDAMIAVGLGRFISGEALCADLVQLANTVQKVRIAGSAALDLAYTACGRLDAYYEQRVFLWDLAAGMLLIEEAGGVVYWWPQPRPHQRSCLAAAKGLAAPLIELLQLTPTTDARTCFDDGAG
jgi:myo-inositol-1(or 4)-monophosphatase